MKTALIIPALNEEPVIGQMLQRIPPTLFDQIIVADNGSTDRTGEIASSLGATVVRREQRGYGIACLAAIAQLNPVIDTIVFMQADLSEVPEECLRLLTPIQDGCADLVIGSRTLGTAEPGALLPHQDFGNRLACTLMRLLFRHTYTDLGPFRAIRRAALECLAMQETSYGWTVEMQVRALQQELRVMEVPVTYKRRAAGVNKVSGNWKASLQAGVRIIGTILRLYVRYGSASKSNSR
ncbi:MAG: glycosyltransferase family 2 protein [Bryobacteraceae bacterium]